MSDLKTILINDSRIEDISSDISFAIQGGAQQNTNQPQSANTSSNTSHAWQINPPSENIVIDRRFLIDTDVEFVVTVANVPLDGIAWSWGASDGFGPYPINSCYLTQNASINNTQISVNTQDIMAPLLRMNDQKIHTMYDGWTPSMVDDVYYNYSDGLNANNNPLSATNNNGMDNKIKPRGCHTITSMTILHQISGGGTDASVESTNVLDTWTITIRAHFTEPILFLSPFISNPCVSNEAGFLGINNISFNFSIDSSLKRVFRTAVARSSSSTGSYYTTYALSSTYNGSGTSGFSSLQMLVNYLSVQPSQYTKISARNILPLLQYDRYILNSGNSTSIAATGTTTLTSSNVALNQIPDTILIFARVPIASQNATNSDSFFTIKKVSINFNNVSGILSSASQQELWLMSQKAGSSQSWAEFSGFANSSNANGGISTIPTIGSILAIQPAYQFNLPDYLSASSLGSYNLQFSVDLINQKGVLSTVELVVITITSGYMVLHLGTASTFTGVLNKDLVLSAKEGAGVPRLSQSDYERLVGGVRDNRGVTNMMKHFKNKMSTTGCGMSAGVMSGGRLGKYIK